MTDKKQRITVTDEFGAPYKITKVWHDNGDGTFSETLYMGGVSLGDVTIEGVAQETTLALLLTELQAKANLVETQPVSAAALPLPSGAATQSTLTDLLTELQAKADLAETQPISATSLPLPTGAATETTQANVKTAIEALAALISESALPVSGPLTDTELAARFPLQVKGPDISTATVFTGQIIVTTAGTAVQGPNVALTNGSWIVGHPDNAGNVAYGNDGADDVTMDNGMVLQPGQFGPPVQVANLNELWFDAADDGYKFCWQKA